MKKLLIVIASVAVGACSGPSSDEIEELQNVDLLPLHMMAKIDPGGYGCPNDASGLEKMGLFQKKKCLGMYSNISNVTINSCIEKEKTVFVCSYSYEFSSEKYGIHPFDAQGSYEEMPDGWVFKH